ncbi:MAG TPA: Gfo/Idh/MocA family oxidoreductase [Microlunatus sp.]|nr:Gfo/Idh/MocA family oxidoreductase [Microlunatus sp.]
MTAVPNDLSTRPLRIGIIGAGIMGRGNALALSREPGVTIAACVSRTRAGAEALADEVAGRGADRPRVHDHPEQLFDDDVDAVVITTPDHQHADLVVAAAQAGRHVLVEKPFATSIEDADRALAAVRAAGVVGMCLFNHRWVPAYAQAHTELATMGDAAVAYARKNDTISIPTEMINWAGSTTSAWFLSSHDIDLVSWLIRDRVVRVYATARWGVLRERGIDTPDAIQIHAEYQRGAVATFESAWISPTSFPTPVDSYIGIVAEGGVIQLDRQAENLVVARPEGLSYPRTLLQRVTHGVPAGAYRDAIVHWIECCRTGAEPLVTLESSRDVTAVLAAAHESLQTRRPVDVPLEASPRS